jgi:toxin CptA
MHNAPSVSYPVGRSRFMGWLALLLWLAGLSAMLAWVPAHLRPIPWPTGLVLLGMAALGVWVAWVWWRQPCGILRWDGQHWLWQGQALSAGAVPAVVLDLQHVVLLHWPSASAGPWLWLEGRQDPQQWRALRRAVYSRAIAPVTEPAGTGADPTTP